ncbi:MAG: lactate utilization protein [Pseudomonadota bacterium]
MSARDAILNRVRASVATPSRSAQDADRARARLSSPARHPIPARVAMQDRETLLALMREHLESQSATVATVADANDVPELIADYLRSNNLPQRVRAGDDAHIASIDWTRTPALEVCEGRADPSDAVGLSRASAAVAETGTLVIASGADNPVTLNFLPETHIVLVDASTVVGPYEDAFDAIRTRFGDGQMPRTLNMISGPSRTGDIGGRLVMGAHGPRRMLVIVVEAGL